MAEALTEEADSMDPTNGSPGEESTNIDLRNADLIIEQLRTFSRSLENLAEETLYSKWKRARDTGTFTTPRSRSFSSVTSPALEGRRHCKVPEKKNSFHVLQENVFRPRYWTIEASPIEMKHRVPTKRDDNNNTVKMKTQNSTSCWVGVQRRRKLAKQYSVTLKFHPRSPITDSEKVSPLNKSGIRPVLLEHDFNGGGGKTTQEVNKTTSETMTRSSPRTLQNPAIAAQFLTEGGWPSFSPKGAGIYIGKEPATKLHLESLMIEIPRQPASMPPSRNLLMCEGGNNCGKRTSVTRPVVQHKLSGGQSNSTNKADTFKLESINKRSVRVQRNNFSLGCTYALISQPTSAKDNSVVSQKMSAEVITKEQRIALEEEFRNLQRVSLELEKDEMGERGLKKSYSFHERKKKVTVSPPGRRFSEVYNNSARNYRSERPAAQVILNNITNTGHKTEKERFQAIERAFEWIRKELAELRAQDKDIMRTFTNIQAGIRNMKLQQSVSGNIDGDFELEGTGRSTDLSASFSYAPLVREFNNKFTRRASLI